MITVGPMLRHAGETDATVWLETDGPCTAAVLGHSARTFQVEGHHYAVVAIRGLEPGSAHPYEVTLDGRTAWPPAGSDLPPPVIRTLDPARAPRIAFGSCRISAPHEPPYTDKGLGKPCGWGIDALRAFALRAAATGIEALPDRLLLLGDQLYADQPSPAVRRYARSRQIDPAAPGRQLEDFEEYAVAYRDAWSDPAIRWLLSTVPTAMIFDDHEIHDEWRISQAWVDEMRARSWYDRRVTGGLMAYWLYQHVGNLTPDQLDRSEVYAALLEAAGDAGPALRAFARAADHQDGESRWSHSHELGGARLVVLDARGGRQLTPGGRRILPDAEWDWIERRLSDFTGHVLIASSIPFLVTPGLHHLEAFSEALCDGVWGAPAARVGERLRQQANLGHWAAFQASFTRFARLLERLASGELGGPPRSIVLLSGDVHHGYVAEVALRRRGAPAPVWQVVSSGLRKPLALGERIAMKAASTRTAHAAGRALARAAGVPDPPLRWRLADRPLYANQIATLALDAAGATLRIETPEGSDWRSPRLRTAIEHRLAESLSK